MRGAAATPAAVRRGVETDDGSSIVEFALAAPFLFLFIAGTLELAMIMLVTVLMEGGMRDAARWGITGQGAGETDRVAAILQIVADSTIGLLDMDEATVHIQSYPTFDDVGQAEAFVDADGDQAWSEGETFTDCNGNGQWDEDRGTDGTGGSGAVVVYRLSYDWPLLTPLMTHVVGDGHWRIEARVVARNEPWKSGDDGEAESCDL